MLPIPGNRNAKKMADDTAKWATRLRGRMTGRMRRAEEAIELLATNHYALAAGVRKDMDALLSRGDIHQEQIVALQQAVEAIATAADNRINDVQQRLVELAAKLDALDSRLKSLEAVTKIEIPDHAKTLTK